MRPSGTFAEARRALAEFWATRAPRERGMLAAAAAVLVLALFYASLLAPALTGRIQLNKNLPALREQVAQLQALSGEAALFSGKAAAPPMAISEQGVRAALARRGLQPQSVVLAGESLKVQFANSSFAAMLEWLGDMQKNARLAVVEADVAALAQPDRVNAALTLRQPRAE